MDTDGDTLLLAAGGGGDALAALMLADALGTSAKAVASFAWERKIFDPVPGPRVPADFVGLQRYGEHNWRLGAATRLRRGRSFLPPLAASTRLPLFLLDPRDGVVGLRRQLLELVRLTHARRTVLVDAGGDILARGTEPGLRSPLADALVLAAAAVLPNPSVFCLGLGLDGELTEAERSRARTSSHAKWVADIPARVALRYRPFLEWHPSEVTGLTCLSALGCRGRVEMRADGLTVNLRPSDAGIYRLDYEAVYRRSLVVDAIETSAGFEEAVDLARQICGRTELEFERRTARRPAEFPGAQLDGEKLAHLEAELVRYSHDAAARGVTHMTLRRIAAVLGLDGAGLFVFRAHLGQRHRPRLQGSLWSCR